MQDSVNKLFENVPEKLVYMRKISISELPEEVQSTVDGIEEVFAIHDAQGQRLALAAGPQIAADLAKEHDLSLMSVH